MLEHPGTLLTAASAAGMLAALVMGAKSAPAGTTKGGWVLPKITWALGPAVGASFAAAGWQLTVQCARAHEENWDIPCKMGGFLLHTGTAIFCAHCLMTLQRLCGARLGNASTLVCCTGGQVVFLALFCNWYSTLPSHDDFHSSRLCAVFGGYLILLVIIIRGYILVSILSPLPPQLLGYFRTCTF